MDFDFSKENIQPLRGGRNVTQLEVALHAQSDSEFQRELIRQKESFEEAIRTYEGDDPLDNWYNFISWVEQSYPKHGHEGNLVALLEDCLKKFEHDERYIHDRRLCKLWIKYIDLQQNPLELFQLLHSQGICTNCADLYRAWAYYHEVVGDFKRADVVFQIGLRNMAQPYEDLVLAHENMFVAAGKHVVQGADECRLLEQRQALTSLRTYKHNHRTMVASTRTGNQVLHTAPGAVYQTGGRTDKSNARASVFEDENQAGPSVGAGAMRVSILDVARRQEKVHKENALKPGAWSQPARKMGSATAVPHRAPAFKVHEDEEETPTVAFPDKIMLPPHFSTMNHDDFSEWRTELFHPDPPDDTKIPMYPKHLVYASNIVEFSPEEIRARKWFEKKHQQQQMPANNSCDMQETMLEEPANMITETQQAVQSILPPQNSYVPSETPRYEPSYVPQPVMPHSYRTSQQFPAGRNSPHLSMHHSLANASHQNPTLPMESDSLKLATYQNHSQAECSSINQSNGARQKQIPVKLVPPHQNSPRSICEPPKKIQSEGDPNNDYTLCMREAMNDVNDLWKDNLTTLQESCVEIPPPISTGQKFQIFEDTQLKEETRKPTCFKTLNFVPFKIKSDESGVQDFNVEMAEPPEWKRPDLQFSIYESNSPVQRKETPNVMKLGNVRPSMAGPSEYNRRPFSSQPLVDVQKETMEEKCFSQPEPFSQFKVPDNCKSPSSSAAFNESCNTQMFNFNLNSKKSSTPFNYKKSVMQQYENSSAENEAMSSNKKKLFVDEAEDREEKEKLSIILETTEFRYTSSSSSGTTAKSTMFNTRESLKAIPETSTSESQHRVTTQEPYASFADYEKSIPTSAISRRTLSSCSTPFLGYDLPKNGQSQQIVHQNNTHEYSHGQNFVTNLHRTTGNEFHASQHVLPKPVGTSPEKCREVFDAESNDSMKDPWGGSAVKSTRMDVDVNKLSQQSFEFKMDTDSSPDVQEPFDETILQKTPSDPFSSKITAALLRKVGFPNARHLSNYVTIQNIPRIVRKETLCLGDERYLIEKILGKGTYGSVFKVLKCSTNEAVAMKFQKPANFWEYYIAKEIQHRMANPHLLKAFLDISVGYFARNSSLLVMEFCKYGSLLDVRNKIKQITGKGMKELVAIYFANEIVTIINALHQCQIIHADIKPDNFLVMRMPPEFGHTSLKLIDYGCSIDLSLFPKGTSFTKVVSTEDFVCTEMKEGRPWTYQTDLYCMAATVHVLLFEKYMQLKAFLDISVGYFARNSSLLVMEFCKYGSLLDVRNKIKQITGKGMKELVAIYFANEIVTIINALHQCQIIHADIKPDNFLVMRMPPEFGHTSLKLIDYGCSIDLSLFPKGTSFTKVVSTEDFVCTEMKEGRPWTYQTDLYCMAATVHVLLFEKYMQVQKRGDVWTIMQRVPRYMRTDLWNTFFFQLLNIESCDKLPDLILPYY